MQTVLAALRSGATINDLAASGNRLGALLAAAYREPANLKPPRRPFAALNGNGPAAWKRPGPDRP